MMRIAVVPLGVGNLGSLTASLKRLGHQVTLWENSATGRADWLVLPGVGSLAGVADSLQKRDLLEPLYDWRRAGAPMLGICLGMQLWFGLGEEGGTGLSWLSGTIPRLDANILPHMGWNDIAVDARGPAWLRPYDGQCFYFVHSYGVNPEDPRVIGARTQYGREEFPSVIAADALIGMQFHPELSGDMGESLLSDVLSLT